MSTKSNPLPSILAQMRNATRSMTTQTDERSSRYNHNANETRNLIDASTSRNQIPLYSKSSSTAVQRLLILLNSSGKPYSRSKKSKNSKLDQGFQVNLPPRFILYTILIFIVLPLVIGSIFLTKQLLFGTLKEDEFHHLRKKEFVRPHLDSNTPTVTSGQVLNITNQAMENDNDQYQDFRLDNQNASMHESEPINDTTLDPKLS